MLPKYEDNPRAYYDALKELTPEQLTKEWQEIDQKEYYYLLECLPPKKFDGVTFMVNEFLNWYLTR